MPPHDLGLLARLDALVELAADRHGLALLPGGRLAAAESRVAARAAGISSARGSTMRGSAMAQRDAVELLRAVAEGVGLLRVRGDRLEATSLRHAWAQIDEGLRAGLVYAAWCHRVPWPVFLHGGPGVEVLVGGRLWVLRLLLGLPAGVEVGLQGLVETVASGLELTSTTGSPALSPPPSSTPWSPSASPTSAPTPAPRRQPPPRPPRHDRDRLRPGRRRRGGLPDRDPGQLTPSGLSGLAAEREGPAGPVMWVTGREVARRMRWRRSIAIHRERRRGRVETMTSSASSRLAILRIASTGIGSTTSPSASTPDSPSRSSSCRSRPLARVLAIL